MKNTESKHISFFWTMSLTLSGLIPWIIGQIFFREPNWIVISSFSIVILTTAPICYWLANRSFAPIPTLNYFRVYLPLWFSVLLLSFGIVWLIYK